MPGVSGRRSGKRHPKEVSAPTKLAHVPRKRRSALTAPGWALATALIASTAVFLAFNMLAAPFGLSRGPRLPEKALRCNRVFFGDVLPPDATLEKVAVVREGGSYGEGEANVAYSVDPTGLPALCVITVRVRSSSTSSYRLGLFLPDKWNSRFLVVGNGGFAGGINWLDILYNFPVTDPKHLSVADTALIADEVIRQCDLADGVQDGIVSTPDRCAPELTVLLCSGKDNGAKNAPTSGKADCLRPAQLETARNVYSDWTLPPNNELLHPGLTFSSEGEWLLILNGSEPVPYGIGYARDFLFDDDGGGGGGGSGSDAPPWDWRTSFNESVVRYADEHDPGNATADDCAALGAVRERGGKVVIYHGLADGLVPTKGTGVYWNRTLDALGGLGGLGGLEDFMRLFLVPGMGHCYGTAVDAPWNFGGAFQAGLIGSGVWSVPGFEDAEHDALMALVDWVEKGKPLDSIVATTWEDPTNSSSG